MLPVPAKEGGARERMRRERRRRGVGSGCVAILGGEMKRGETMVGLYRGKMNVTCKIQYTDNEVFI